MFRFLIVVMFNISLMQAMYKLPQPPYYSHRAIQSSEVAGVFKIISDAYPDLNIKDYKYHFGNHGWNQNFYIDFISNDNGKMIYSFDYNPQTKELTKKDC